jgi:DNA-binding MarR family transcriptional regulator
MDNPTPDPLEPTLSGPQVAALLAAHGQAVAPGVPGQPFANMLCFSVYAAQLAFNRLYKQLLAPHGLTYLQYLVLVALAQAQDRTVGELGDVLFLESNTLTPLLKRMEAAGLVVRRRDSQDERVVRVALAPAGAKVVGEVECVPLDVLGALDMPLGDLQQMKAAMDRLGAELRKTGS